MKRLATKANTIPPNSDYPYGDIRDRVGTTPGTQVNRINHADFHQFFEKMFAESGLTANNLPDNETNGFQLYQALFKVAIRKSQLVVRLTQTGTSNPVVTLLYNDFGITSITCTRLFAGSYRLQIPGGFDSIPGIMLIPNTGVATMTVSSTISPVLANGYVYINTNDGTTDVDGILTDYTVVLEVYS